MKTCFKCGESKPHSEFYKHAAMADGYLGKCKECTKADVRAYWKEHGTVLRQTDLMRRKVQKQANTAVGNAVRDGRLVKDATCHYCRCDDAKLVAHHWDYYRPLDVTWLCLRCHRIADMARRDAEIRVVVQLEQSA